MRLRKEIGPRKACVNETVMALGYLKLCEVIIMVN